MKKILAPILSLSLVLSPTLAYGQESQSANIAKMALSMANGIIGASVLTKCKLGTTQPSILTYSAGGIIYLASEFAIAKDKKNAVADIANSANQETSDFQLKLFEAQLKDEKSNLAFIKKKKIFQEVIATVYLGATVLAFTEGAMEILGKPSFAACQSNGLQNGIVVKAISGAYSAIGSIASSSDRSAKGMATVGVTSAATSIGISYLMDLFTVTTVSADIASIPLLNTAWGRKGFFGGATAISAFVALDLGKQKRSSENKISLIQKQIDAFKKDTESPDAPDLEGFGTEENPGPLNIKNGDIKTLASSPVKDKYCVSNIGGKIEYSTAACKNSIKFTSPKLNSNFFNADLQRFSNTTNDLANAIASGNMAKADIEIGSLLSQAANLEKLRDNLLTDLNKKLKESGKPAIKFDSNDEMLKQMAAVGNDLKKNGHDASGFLNNDLAKTNSNDIKKEDSSSVNISPDTASTPVVSASPLIEDISLGNTEENSEFENSGSVATLSDRLNEFESSTSDVVSDPGVSIFKQVSNRYLLNYEKVLNRKVIPQENPADNK